MFGVKKLDRYVVMKFLPLFAAAFFICLFVFMMQMTWRYVDELIGKGLSLDILAQFFWYMAITLIPMSLPLAVLLASLITFGNMGEQLELLSMKAAGVPLIRIMRPIFIIVLCITGTSFYFQNKTSPNAQISLATLLFSMKQAQPAVEIPEGVFYNGVPNLNLYVEHKHAETGMLYNVIIYKTDQGFERAQIVLADSARLEMTADKLHLILDLWQGEQFENLKDGTSGSIETKGMPYDRETFQYKRFIVDFDSNFALMDKELLSDSPKAKNMKRITESVDSMEHEMDSVAKLYLSEARGGWLPDYRLDRAAKKQPSKAKKVPLDTLLSQATPEQLAQARQGVGNQVRAAVSDLEWKQTTTQAGDNFIRVHWVEWHTKITLSLACIFFFFVGAPLGAIIRKGGLGMPAIISVLIFIFYYIINTSGMKMAREGSWNMVFGMWISSFVLIPFGVYLTYMSNRDSVVFNAELYMNVFRRLFGLRVKRQLFRKDVIITPPDYDRLPGDIAALRDACREYSQSAKLYKAPNYFKTFFSMHIDRRAEEIAEMMERIVEQLSNSREQTELGLASELPTIFPRAHTAPFTRRRWNMLAGALFPIGLLLWVRIWRFRLRLFADLRNIAKVCDQLLQVLAHEKVVAESADAATAPTSTAGTPPKLSTKRIVLTAALLIVLFAAGYFAFSALHKDAARRPATPENAGQGAPASGQEAASTPVDVKPFDAPDGKRMFRPVEAADAPIPPDEIDAPEKRGEGGDEAAP